MRSNLERLLFSETPDSLGRSPVTQRVSAFMVAAFTVTTTWWHSDPVLQALLASDLGVSLSQRHRPILLSHKKGVVCDFKTQVAVKILNNRL